MPSSTFRTKRPEQSPATRNAQDLTDARENLSRNDPDGSESEDGISVESIPSLEDMLLGEDEVRESTHTELLEYELEYATSYVKRLHQVAKCQDEASKLQKKIAKLQNEGSKYQKEAAKNHDAILKIRAERSRWERDGRSHSDQDTCATPFTSDNESGGLPSKRRRNNRDSISDQPRKKKPRKVDDQADGGEDSEVRDQHDGSEDIGADDHVDDGEDSGGEESETIGKEESAGPVNSSVPRMSREEMLKITRKHVTKRYKVDGLREVMDCRCWMFLQDWVSEEVFVREASKRHDVKAPWPRVYYRLWHAAYEEMGCIEEDGYLAKTVPHFTYEDIFDY